MLEKYEASLKQRDLDDIPMHASPLLNGHDHYDGLDLKTRKSLFVAFFIMLQHLPIRYRTFIYRRSELPDQEAFVTRMCEDIAMLLYDELPYFQSFNKVKIYYDNGQSIVAQSLHKAIDYALSKESVLYRQTRSADYRLSQVADLLCALELTAQKYRNCEATAADNKFFGTASDFKNNYMRIIKRKRL